ncbi:heavy metal translocating P-type ATPase [Halovivax cerinus]|uniref:Heavy metal translocating P-type ATPase n=1 Tax=Halovivax cerinus TaxID=1487865 RepID=A0ABD5NTG2_9EURY|nr:HAD-IC family P-type ATPase [Halovivax cerinus]
MTAGESGGDRTCAFCGTAVASDGAAGTGRRSAPSPPADDEPAPSGPYCCPGCRHLDDALQPASAGDRARDSASPVDAVLPGDGAADGADATEPDDSRDGELVRTYFRVDGMHAAHDETYLESVAASRDGVADASASYVTEAVRVDHDPGRITPDDLESALTGVGFTAFVRERGAREAGDGVGRDRPQLSGDDRGIGTDVTGETYREREVAGFRKRRADDFLEMRYVLGVVFGSFLLVPYVVLFYPAALADLTGWGALSLFGGPMELDWGVLPLFLVVTGAIVYLTGRPLLRGAYIALRLRRPNTDLLATLPIVAAVVYGTLSVLVGRSDLYFDLAIVVSALVMGAIYREATVKRDAASRLTALTRASVAEARRLDTDGSTSVVPTDELSTGDRILVRQGERIPVDGTLAEGRCTVAEAVLTGESLPQERTAGAAVVGGSTVTAGSAVVTVGDEPTSRLDGLTRRVWDLQSASHGASDRADELAGRALPLVVGGAIVAATATLLAGDGLVASLRHLLLAVIVASPWAFAFATPVSVATSLREAADAGVVVFDETVFDRLRDVDTMIFDKTGTLTTGEMTVRDATGPATARRAAAALERRAAHPAADAIVDVFGPDTDEDGPGRGPSEPGGAPSERDGGGDERDTLRGDGGTAERDRTGGGGDDSEAGPTDGGGDGTEAGPTDGGGDGTEADPTDGGGDGSDADPTDAGGDGSEASPTDSHAERAGSDSTVDDGAMDDRHPTVESFETHPTGVAGTVDGETTLVGHPSLFDSRGWTVDDEIAATVASIRDAGHLPVVVGRDGRAVGVVTVGDRPRESWAETVDVLSSRNVDVIVLTGDDDSATEFLADHDGVDAVYASVTPSGKVEAVRRLAAAGQVAMVGDGTNDAPALAAADMGVALGGGTALAADAADIAIADDDLTGVERAFALADRARRRRRGTIWLSCTYNAIAIPAALAGLANPLVTMTGVAVTATAIVAYASYPLGLGRR